MGPRRNSIVWQHFGFVGDTEVRCIHCFKIIKYTQSTSTHNLIRHLQAIHKKEFSRKTDAPAGVMSDVAETEFNHSDILSEVIITEEETVKVQPPLPTPQQKPKNVKQILQSLPPPSNTEKEPEFVVTRDTMESSNNFIIQEECEFDAFGRNVVLQLKALPLKEALEAEELILGILRRQRIRVLDRR